MDKPHVIIEDDCKIEINPPHFQDQATQDYIQKVKSLLDEYTKTLILQLKESGKNSKEIFQAIQDDPQRQKMLNELVKFNACSPRVNAESIISQEKKNDDQTA